jgi:adenosylhomocysteine nucleosidase
MSMELRPIVKLLDARPSKEAGMKVYLGRRGTVDVVVSQIGVGPPAAARATDRLLEHFAVDHVLVCGIAGGIGSSATIGTVLVPEVVLDLSSGQEYRPAPLGEITPDGKIGTVDELITDPSRLDGLIDQGVIALEMESAGVASVCEARGVPWTVFRVISDRPDDGYTDDSVLGVLRPDGSTDIGAALRLMATRPSRIRGFVRLGRDASMAAAKAAKTTLNALG